MSVGTAIALKRMLGGQRGGEVRRVGESVPMVARAVSDEDEDDAAARCPGTSSAAVAGRGNTARPDIVGEELVEILVPSVP